MASGELLLLNFNYSQQFQISTPQVVVIRRLEFISKRIQCKLIQYTRLLSNYEKQIELIANPRYAFLIFNDIERSLTEPFNESDMMTSLMSHQWLLNWINCFCCSGAESLHWFSWLAKTAAWQRPYRKQCWAAIWFDVNNIKWFRCKLKNQKPIANVQVFIDSHQLPTTQKR